MNKYKTIIEIWAYALIVALSFYSAPFDMPPIFRYLLLIMLMPTWLLIVLRPVFLSNSLPGHSLYNPIGFIELHIDNTHKGSKIQFYKLCARTIREGIKQNKEVVFATWLITEARINNIFSGAILNLKPSVIEIFLLKLIRWRYSIMNNTPALNNPFIKVVIKPNLLTAQQIRMIEKLAK